MSDLKAIVHVESRRRFCNILNTSATPASPPWVAAKMASTYLDFGAASWQRQSVLMSITAADSQFRGTDLDFGRSLHNLLHYLGLATAETLVDL